MQHVVLRYLCKSTKTRLCDADTNVSINVEDIAKAEAAVQKHHLLAAAHKDSKLERASSKGLAGLLGSSWLSLFYARLLPD